MRERIRIFVSSPGDVTAPREIATQIIEGLAQDFARFFTIEPYLWQNEPLSAAAHFQDEIESPSNFDVVILILGQRLGTPLPEKTAVGEYRGIDGRRASLLSIRFPSYRPLLSREESCLRHL
jgi:hypothetical protein